MSTRDDEHARRIERYVRAGLNMGEYGGSQVDRVKLAGCCCIVAALAVFWVSVAYFVMWAVS